jgi:hydroxybutyrate-dimer hydrolase
LLSADTTATQADEALQKLRDYGWEAEAAILHASHATFEVAPAVSVTFANAIARASVKDNLCSYSYAATIAQGRVTLLALATMAATGNGLSLTGAEGFNLDGALCLRNLLSGNGAAATALRAGIDETRRNDNLRGRPGDPTHCCRSTTRRARTPR